MCRSCLTMLTPDREIEAIRLTRLGLLKVMRPQNIWFFLTAGEAGVGVAYAALAEK